MKILWVLDKELDRSSTREYAPMLAKILMTKGHEVKLLARFRRKQYDHGISTIYLPTLPWRRIRRLSFIILLNIRAPRIISKWNPHVVLIDRPFAVFGMLTSVLRCKYTKRRTRFVLDVRSPPVKRNPFNHWLFKIGIKSAHKFGMACTVITPGVESLITRAGGYSSGEIGIWSSGFDQKTFDPVTAIIPESWPFPQKFVVIYHGSLSEDRGLLETVQAMRYTSSNICLVLLGDGPMRSALEDCVRDQKLTEKVCFINSVLYDDVPGFLKAADVGLVPLPDRWEWQVSSPLKLIEYMAMAKPVIATNIAAHSTILGSQAEAIKVQCGYRVDPKDIAEGINEANKRWGRGYFSGINRNIAIGAFTSEQQMTRLEEYLNCAVMQEAQYAR